MKRIFSVSETALAMRMSERRVRKLLSEGRIKGQMVGGSWIVFEFGFKEKTRGRKPKGGRG